MHRIYAGIGVTASLEIHCPTCGRVAFDGMVDVRISKIHSFIRGESHRVSMIRKRGGSLLN